MKAFTVKYNENRYSVKPLSGHIQRFKVNVDGYDVFFENDMDGHLRAEATHSVNMSLLLALADKIEQNSRH